MTINSEWNTHTSDVLRILGGCSPTLLDDGQRILTTQKPPSTTNNNYKYSPERRRDAHWDYQLLPQSVSFHSFIHSFIHSSLFLLHTNSYTSLHSLTLPVQSRRITSCGASNWIRVDAAAVFVSDHLGCEPNTFGLLCAADHFGREEIVERKEHDVFRAAMCSVQLHRELVVVAVLLFLLPVNEVSLTRWISIFRRSTFWLIWYNRVPIIAFGTVLGSIIVATTFIYREYIIAFSTIQVSY